MAIKVSISHCTKYHFDRPVSVHPHLIRLRPAPHCRTPVEAYSLKISPKDHFINWQQDPFGNYLARLVFPKPTALLSVEVNMVADMTVINPFDFFLEEAAEHFPFQYDKRLKQDLLPYLETPEQGPLLKAWLEGVDRARQPTVPFLINLNHRLREDIDYLVRMAPGVQSCEETLKLKSGSCRDSTWLLVQILRRLGFAARFVSGYLVQLTADFAALDGPSGPERDFTDLHAWAEAYIPGAGWIGLDPTSGLLAGEGHIPLACTPEPASAAPITGSTDPCEVEFRFANEVIRIHEDPRVTRPYSDTAWAEINALGRQIDEVLREEDVRLTMGGEPTFVSIDDMQGAEWNTAALGEKKRELAGLLLGRLRQRFAPDGLVHIGQGKWYPGEPLPRWALSLIWRKDGKPVWRDPKWLSEGAGKGTAGADEARRLIEYLADEIGVPRQRVVSGYEDVLHYLKREQDLPVNVHPLDNKLKDPLERRRLTELMAGGLGAVRGYALPLKWRRTGDGAGAWTSSPWPFRGGHMYLVPGDSPMGLRLPLDSLPWRLPDPTEVDAERDPFEQRGELPECRPRATAAQDEDQDPREVIHTAVCVEPRNGHLHVFLPPQTHLEYYLDLVDRVEAAASRCGTAVVIEGYTPPVDPRQQHLQITPDPGVIEVNIHHAADWEELSGIIETVYEEARQARLGTEKFMLDGRHSGTGGGNHVTLGGPTAADSPFLRRPDLLGSLITYWQHHPALSYLFSGLFIGPTSQAPRVDEARDDNLYELQLAMQRLPAGDSEQPWLVDRLLRNFLIDLTGNTHRAEFCIDKLYSPDHAGGRRGLVEFRAFEMPPHARMTMVQMLLLRSMVARFWNRPYQRGLIRWGTALHDRFMLRHFVWEDLKDVIRDMQEAGYPLQEEWFTPFLEFRFPHIGTIHLNGMQLDLHAALEPWHVLGEETTTQGTARFVDSSVERIQVSTHDLIGERYSVTCNGRRVPLHPTGIHGNHVAGVRYKAWQQPHSLHATIGAHTPLVFDIIDNCNERSIGGCTYHVSHPGGRNYEVFPVNANEAEARRNARFWPHGMTGGRIRIPTEPEAPEFPLTLDLRAIPKG